MKLREWEYHINTDVVPYKTFTNELWHISQEYYAYDVIYMTPDEREDYLRKQFELNLRSMEVDGEVIRMGRYDFWAEPVDA